MSNNLSTLKLPKSVGDYSRETAKDRRCGDIVWACAFEFNMKKNAFGLSQEPTRGMLSYTDCEGTHAGYDKPDSPQF